MKALGKTTKFAISSIGRVNDARLSISADKLFVQLFFEHASEETLFFDTMTFNYNGKKNTKKTLSWI